MQVIWLNVAPQSRLHWRYGVATNHIHNCHEECVLENNDVLTIIHTDDIIKWEDSIGNILNGKVSS